MSTNQSNKEAWRKFLGIKDHSATLESGRVGGSIGRTAGRSSGGSGGGELDSDSVPEGDGTDGAEKGDGAADAGKQLKPGDNADRLEDLYDCETGEEVTIDGLGKKGSERYPTGFQNCEGSKSFPECGKNPEQLMVGFAFANINTGEYRAYDFWSPVGYEADACKKATDGTGVMVGGYCESRSGQWQGLAGPANKAYSELTESQKYNACVPFGGSWPAPDRNHLTWNKEKGCFEPLCPELNNQVLDKYKACEEDRILCDKDGNKVKVTVDGDTVKVTQAKYNQTAEIKDGKVQTVKKLTESQTEAEFK